MSPPQEASALQDLAGKRFGNWTVLYGSHKDAHGKLHWFCRCEGCGREKTVLQRDLLHGTSAQCRSCGKKEAGKKNRMHPWKRNATTVFRKYSDGNLTFDEFLNLTSMKCHWCEADPSNSYFVGYSKGYSTEWLKALASHPFVYNGLDRIDNDRGHDSDNVVPSCADCNKARSDKTVEEFVAHVKRMYHRMSRMEASGLSIHERGQVS